MQCPSCQNKRKFEILEKVKKYKIVRCINCELFFTDPKVLSNRDWYEKTLVDKTAMVHPKVWLKWQDKIYEQFLKRRKVGQTLLDVGCGDGEFIKRAQKKGYKVVGIDFNRILIEKIREKHNLEVYPIKFEEFVLKFPERTFDVVTFFEVLEHAGDPGNFLTLVKNKLKHNGFISLSVPNRDRFRLGHEKFPEWDSPPHHLTWWNINSLKKFLRLKGFKILELKEFKKILKSKTWQKKVEVNGPYLYILAQKY